jgi:hypothetical protein
VKENALQGSITMMANLGGMDDSKNYTNRWKKMSKNNSLTYFGQVKTKTPSTNGIWRFTTGAISDDWDSDAAANLDDLTNRIRDGVKTRKQVLLDVPTNGIRTDDFKDFLKKGQATEILRIRVFLPELKAFKINLLLKRVTVLAEPMPFKDEEFKTAGLMFKFRVKDADFEGA